MQPAKAMGLAAIAAVILTAAAQPSDSINTVDASYFEGRWAFDEETCDQPTNWTLLADGNFVSEDLTGSWRWDAGQLTLNLIDLAIDEETEEAGGRFQMEGPVTISGPGRFTFKIEPDDYLMKRCE